MSKARAPLRHTAGPGALEATVTLWPWVPRSERVDLAEYADPDHPRRVGIYLDSGESVSVCGGFAEPARPEGKVRWETYRPESPLYTVVDDEAHPVGGEPLAEVWLDADTDRIDTADIRDCRVLPPEGDDD